MFYFGYASRCSALVKRVASNGELLVAHATWATYAEMLRVYKHVRTHYRSAATYMKNSARTGAATSGEQRQSFSSYPGFISSTDDFFILSRFGVDDVWLVC